MKQVGSYEAKTHLPRLLDEVANGEIIEITRKGVPVARLVPLRPHDDRPIAEILRANRERRRQLPSLGCTLRELIDQGRRF